jgi:hypothetical protein
VPAMSAETYFRDRLRSLRGCLASRSWHSWISSGVAGFCGEGSLAVGCGVSAGVSAEGWGRQRAQVGL